MQKRFIASLAKRPERPAPICSLTNLAAFVVGAIALGACTDQQQITQIQPSDPNRIIICGDGCGGGGGGSTPPTASPSVQLSPVTTGEIDGPLGLITTTVTINNPGSTINNATIRVFVAQGTTARQAPATALNCPGAARGSLPHGICQFPVTVSASNALPGSGTYVPGAATLRADVSLPGLTITQTEPVTLTVGLVSTQISGGFNLERQPATFTVQVSNTGDRVLSNLSYELFLTQGKPATATRNLSNVQLQCAGVLTAPGALNPHMTCTMSFLAVTSNSTPGSGTLVPGPATATLVLLQGGSILVQHTFATNIFDAHFSTAVASDTASVIDGVAHTFAASVLGNQPSTSPIPAIVFGRIRQGSTQRGQINAQINCGGSAVIVAGACAVTGTYSASNTAPGNGTLIPGPAVLDLFLVGITDQRLDTIDVHSTAITLTSASVGGAPTIGTVTLSGRAVIGSPGPSVPVAIQLSNPGPATKGTTVRIQLQQGASARDAGNGTLPLDCGAGAGVIPAGGCILNTHFAVSNISIGDGTFIPGAATLGVIITDSVAGSIRKFTSIPLVTQ